MKTYKSLIETKGPYNIQIIKTAIGNANKLSTTVKKIDGDTGEVQKLVKEVEGKLNKILAQEEN